MITKIQAEEYSQKFGIDTFTVYREYLQIVILNLLFGLENSKDLVFKGGTALRLVYGSPRFSEDLDFTAHCSQKEVKKIIETLTENVESEVPNIDFKYLDSLAGVQGKFYLPVDISKQRLTVKTDFSFRTKVKNINQIVIETSLPVTSFSLVQVMAKKEILAEKIGAIYTRSRGRDIYDLWWLLNNQTDFNQELINEKLNFLDIEYDRRKLIDKIESYPQKKLFHELNKFLPLKDRKLLSKLKELLVEKIGNSG